MTHYTPDDLALAERHIIEGEERIKRQDTIIADLRARGLPFMEAEKLATLLRATLAEFRSHRNAIADALEKKAGGPIAPDFG